LKRGEEVGLPKSYKFWKSKNLKVLPMKGEGYHADTEYKIWHHRRYLGPGDPAATDVAGDHLYWIDHQPEGRQ
jgi:hypothetical protein